MSSSHHKNEAPSARAQLAQTEQAHVESEHELPLKQLGDLWVFDLPTDTPAVTGARVKELLDGTP